MCSYSILLCKLNKLGIRDTALQWFTSYLQGRQQKVDINGSLSSSRSLDISVLQDSILGPILFFVIIMIYIFSPLFLQACLLTTLPVLTQTLIFTHL